MNHNRISNEIIWAAGILLICTLAGLYLFINLHPKNSVPVSAEIVTVSTKAEIITTDTLSTSEDIVSNTDFHSSEMTSDSEHISSEKNTYDCPIDFASLWEINKDVYAWISIPGTIIDYPILQHETDDSYYLNYNIDGTEGFPGCIYTEKVNSKDFTDNNTAIYGHDMRNGTMFTDLHKFRDADFFEKNDTIYIYTPEEQLTYKIFASYLYDNRHLMNSFDFSDPEVYANYLTEIQNGDFEEMNLRKDIKIADTDKIITLITCTRGQPEKRVYVQAVLE